MGVGIQTEKHNWIGKKKTGPSWLKVESDRFGPVPILVLIVKKLDRLCIFKFLNPQLIFP